MEPENRQLTTAAPTYPTLLWRLWLVRARLDARVVVRMVRPHNTADDRRLAALLVGAGTALVMVLGGVVSGFALTTSLLLVAVGFFGALAVSLVLLFGMDDYDCEGELALVTELLPEAKRAARRTARQAVRNYNPPGGAAVISVAPRWPSGVDCPRSNRTPRTRPPCRTPRPSARRSTTASPRRSAGRHSSASAG